VEYQDMQDSTRTLSANPMLSRLLQHEIDHLDGILFTDKAEVQTISFISDFDEYKTQAKLVQL
ncbi:MAG TPA: peptide deformylase, partial [Methylomirabilota bacterium]|nr:peptide deformylase [Methylomirabilota bacterium]